MKNLFLIPAFCLCMGAFEGKTVAQTYDPYAVALINNLIANNNLQATPNDPASWEFAMWAEDPTQYELYRLDLDSHGLTGAVSLAGLKWLKHLSCQFNNIAQLNISECIFLEYLNCNDNVLTQLNINGCRRLRDLRCNNNLLTQLNFGGCTEIGVIWCRNNKITQLNVSGLSELSDLYCSDNNLTQLNVTGLWEFRDLYCQNNNLTQLDLSGCTEFRVLSCQYNNLTQLMVNDCNKMSSLICNNNNLSALSLIGLTSLQPSSANLSDQSVSFTLYNNGWDLYTYSTALNNPVFSEDAISYADGQLQSTDNTVLESDFEAETGLSDINLSGKMHFSYSGESSIEEFFQNAALQVFPNPTTGALRISPAGGGLRGWNNGALRIEDIEVFDIYGRKQKAECRRQNAECRRSIGN